MFKVLIHGVLLAVASCLLFASPSIAAETVRGNVVSVQWLEQNLRRDDLLLIDASPAPMYAARHIPGAINIDVFSYGGREHSPAEMEQRLRSWGISAGKKVVIYDQGGFYLATRVFFDLFYYGLPSADLHILDGGLAKWQESGGAVTKDPTPAPPEGTFRVTQIREDARVRLPEFLDASGDPAHHALVEALEPSYHFGAAKFFDRAGHVPNAIMLPSADFFNPDKTFKSPEEIRRMLDYLGVRPEQTIHAHCGGGVAASVPYFVLKFMLDYPKVKLYVGSLLEWLQDERGLPLWTYDAPFSKRDAAWLAGWGSPMLRSFGMARISVVDVRPAAAYALGHVPYALNIPGEVFRRNLTDPSGLAALLGPAGVNASDEAVVVSDGGLNPASALAFLALERLGQKKVSILMEAVDEWGLRGYPLTKETTFVGPRRSPQELAVPATVYPVNARAGVIRDPGETQGLYPKVFIASGKNAPAKSPAGKVVHVPYTDLVNAEGTPRAAKDLWSLLAKAGVPRYAEIVCFADDPGEAAVNYFILKLMGYPDVKVWVN